MLSVIWNASMQRRAGLVTACLALIVTTQLTGAGKSPMRVLKYDPAADKIDLFDGLESGSLAVRIVAHDVKGGNVFVENLTKKPLTVDLPDAVAMVHVLKQFNNNAFAQFGNNAIGNNGFGNNGFGSSSGLLGQGSQQGGGQSLGAGFGQQQGLQTGGTVANFQNQFNGNGLFSIPAERIAQVPYQSVCLNYGKPDPSPRMTYQPVKIEEFSQDEVLQVTLREFGRGKLQQKTAQAACWHLTDKLTWGELAGLKDYTLPGVYSSQVPTFRTTELESARDLVTAMTKRIAQQTKADSKPASKTRPVSQTVRTRR